MRYPKTTSDYLFLVTFSMFVRLVVTLQSNDADNITAYSNILEVILAVSTPSSTTDELDSQPATSHHGNISAQNDGNRKTFDVRNVTTDNHSLSDVLKQLKRGAQKFRSILFKFRKTYSRDKQVVFNSTELPSVGNLEKAEDGAKIKRIKIVNKNQQSNRIISRTNFRKVSLANNSASSARSLTGKRSISVAYIRNPFQLTSAPPTSDTVVSHITQGPKPKLYSGTQTDSNVGPQATKVQSSTSLLNDMHDLGQQDHKPRYDSSKLPGVKSRATNSRLNLPPLIDPPEVFRKTYDINGPATSMISGEPDYGHLLNSLTQRDAPVPLGEPLDFTCLRPPSAGYARGLNRATADVDTDGQQLYIYTLKQLMYTLLKGRVVDRFNLTQCFFRLIEASNRMRNVKLYFPDHPIEPFVLDLCNVSAHCLRHHQHDVVGRILNAPDNVKILAQIVHRDAYCYVKQYECRMYPEFAQLISSASLLQIKMSIILLSLGAGLAITIRD